MIDSVLNLLFRCSHRRLTRPMAPVTKAGKPQSQTYVVCLDCGKQFEYDVQTMQMGKPIDRSHESAVLPQVQQRSKLKMALWAAVPAGVLLGTVLKNKRKNGKPPGDPSAGG
jgi:DNA-directed RNA polymerase subunit RPC12/RpoP